MSSCANAAKEKGKIIAFEKDIDLHIPFLSGYVPFVWSPDSRYIAFVKEGNTIGIVNIETGALRDISGFHVNSSNKYAWIDNLAWSPDGQLLAASSRDELRVVRVGDGKVMNAFSVIHDLPPESPVRFSKMEFSENSKKLVIASLWDSDFALLNSFDLATNTLTPLMYPPGKPLVPPPGFEKYTAKRVEPDDFRFTRYQGHLYYTASMGRLQEFWDYLKTCPRDKFGKWNTGGKVGMPAICMLADLGDGTEVRSITVLKFPEQTLMPGMLTPDPSESAIQQVHYYPPSNKLVLLRQSPSITSPDGSWKGNPNQRFETFTPTRQSIITFCEQWHGNTGVISEQVLHPFKPFILFGQDVPVDDNLRKAYLLDGKLRKKVPGAVDLVLYDILTGKEIDRIRRHQSYPPYMTYIKLAMSTGRISISPDGKHFTYYQGAGYLMPLYKINVNYKEH